MSRLAIVDPGDLGSRGWDVVREHTVIGRGHEADWSIPDASVSRRHAMVHHYWDHDEIEDLRSRHGTFVNGHRVSGRTRLTPGDVVQLAGVTLRYLPDRSGPRSHRPGATSTFTVDDQHAGTINNVGGNQYNQYVQQIIDARDDAMRQIASMNTASRIFFVTGYALALTGVLGFIGSVVLQITKETDISSPEAFRSSTALVEVFGVPAIAVAMAVALVGFALAGTGAVIHMAADRRSDHLDRDHPLPPGWVG